MKSFFEFLKKDKNQISESYSFKVEKPTGYGTLLTAKDIGIEFKGAFALHPTVESELKKCKTCVNTNRECKCNDKN